MVHIELRDYFEGATLGQTKVESLPVPPMEGDVITLPDIHGQFRVDGRWLSIREKDLYMILAVTEICRRAVERK